MLSCMHARLWCWQLAWLLVCLLRCGLLRILPKEAAQVLKERCHPLGRHCAQREDALIVTELHWQSAKRVQMQARQFEACQPHWQPSVA
jgi:hypothetical protein